MNLKQLFKISLNYHGQTHTYHRHAKSEDHALRLACMALADEAKINMMPIFNHFCSNRKDNYRIEKVNKKGRR